MLSEIINFFAKNIFVIVTSVIAILALFQTKKQIKLSNKQNLFDRRLNNYSIVTGLIKLYGENEHLIVKKHKQNEVLDVKYLFF